MTLWFAALFAGLMVVAFAKLAELALALFAVLCSGRAWMPLLLAPTIGMLTVWLTQRYFPGAQGSGIPQVIAATRLAAQGKAVNTLLSLRIACGKIRFWRLCASRRLLGRSRRPFGSGHRLDHARRS